VNELNCTPNLDHNIFIPRDDLSLRSYFVKEHLTDPNLLGLSFYFQTQFLNSYKHDEFINERFTDGKQNFSIITAPIPTVCEDGSIGIFFIISEQLNSIPSDFENLCRIFGRLFSNWLSKYNDCIFSRCEQINLQTIQQVKTPREVKDMKNDEVIVRKATES
jgi:hypothetical protein